MIDVAFFFVRYTPFWAVPLFFIAGEFGYLFWLKEDRIISTFFFLNMLMSFFFIVYYFWSGGPERSVKLLQSLLLNI